MGARLGLGGAEVQQTLMSVIRTAVLSINLFHSAPMILTSQSILLLSIRRM